MTKIAALSISGNKLKKTLDRMPCISVWNIGMGMEHRGRGGGRSLFYDPGLTLTYFMARSNLVPVVLSDMEI